MEIKREWLTANQVSKKLGVGNTRVIGLIKSGKLPGIDLNKERPAMKPFYRVRVDDLEKYLASLAVTPKPKVVPRRKSSRCVKNYFGSSSEA